LSQAGIGKAQVSACAKDPEEENQQHRGCQDDQQRLSSQHDHRVQINISTTASMVVAAAIE
jgi:hypothetical protein